MERRPLLSAVSFLAPPNAWLVLFFVLPMATMVMYSFWQVVDYQIVADFTFRNYQRLTGNLYVTVFWRTIRISIIVTVLSLLIVLIGLVPVYLLTRVFITGQEQAEGQKKMRTRTVRS